MRKDLNESSSYLFVFGDWRGLILVRTKEVVEARDVDSLGNDATNKRIRTNILCSEWCSTGMIASCALQLRANQCRYFLQA
jgi:hypothetical protein